MSPLDVWGGAGYFARVILVTLGGLAALLVFIVVDRWRAFRVESASAPQLRRRLHALAAIRTTAPMLGFLGTLLGVINMLAGLAMTGSVDLRAFGAGMGEALVMTVLGLLVGLPAWWAHGYFSARAERILAGA